MPNPKHLAVVTQGAAAIQAWRERNRDVRLDLTEALLGSADLRGADLSGADLWGAFLMGAHLHGADLSGARLSDSSLFGAILEGANLGGVQLENANLSHANLTGASLAGASLIAANLFAANLKDANLVGACLSSALLVHTNLTGANLAGALLSHTTVATDVTGAVGLERVEHRGPSYLSHELLFRRTARPWPLRFLRGCGLTDAEITNARDAAATPHEYLSGFISYSKEDERFALKLHDALQTKGIRCWLDSKDILPGDGIGQKINEGVQLSDRVLLCCSKHSLTSWWVKQEVIRAFEKERRLGKERGTEVLAVIPLDLDGHLFDDRCTFEYGPTLRARHAPKFGGWDSDERVFEVQVQRVVDAMRVQDGSREARLAPRP